MAQAVDRPDDGSASPLPVRLLRPVVGMTVGAALVSPRTIPFTMSLLALAILAALWSEGRLRSAWPKLAAAEWITLAFIGLCLASALWAAQPGAALSPVLATFGFFCGCIFISQAIAGESDEVISRISRGLVAGLIFGLLFLLFEIVSHQSIKLWLYTTFDVPPSWLRPPAFFRWNDGKLVEILPVDLTRNIAPLTLTIWAGLLVANSRWSRTAARVLFVLAFVVIMMSEHETSKVAIIWSGLVYLLARRNLAWSQNLLRVSWVMACLAAIPLTLTLHRLDLHNSPTLPQSLRHRIIIWNHTAEETLKAPLLGIGAGMMYRLDPKGVVPEEGEEWSGASPHAHNAYLQTWFELGAVGAALLALLGLAILARIERVAEQVRPYAHATFAAAMAMAAASYGVWQPWFIAMFEMCVVMFVIAMRFASSNAHKQARATL